MVNHRESFTKIQNAFDNVSRLNALLVTHHSWGRILEQTSSR